MLEASDYHSMTMAKGARFLEGLKELKKNHRIVGDVDGLGLALRIEICAAEDGFTPDKAMVDKMCDVAMSGALQARGHRYGLVLDVGGYYKNVITLAPSLEISDEEIDLALELLDQLFTRCVRRPFLG
jgi:4-aminobutyrate aminotransferase / (S)-3-amino-2-methylpropionate transaminase / 5-aminovalerate transaminase